MKRAGVQPNQTHDEPAHAMREGPAVAFVEAGSYFRVDFSGAVDLAGLFRRRDDLLEALRFHLAPATTLRVLFDTRRARFESESVHRSMRDVFGDVAEEFATCSVAAAVLNPYSNGELSPDQAYFTDESEALAWLLTT